MVSDHPSVRPPVCLITCLSPCLAVQKHEAAKAVFSKLPAASVKEVQSQWAALNPDTPLPAEDLNAIREHHCIRAYLVSHLSLRVCTPVCVFVSLSVCLIVFFPKSSFPRKPTRPSAIGSATVAPPRRSLSPPPRLNSQRE